MNLHYFHCCNETPSLRHLTSFSSAKHQLQPWGMATSLVTLDKTICRGMQAIIIITIMVTPELPLGSDSDCKRSQEILSCQQNT